MAFNAYLKAEYSDIQGMMNSDILKNLTAIRFESDQTASLISFRLMVVL